MAQIILYPTETIYALGVNAFDEDAWQDLCLLKNRQLSKTASWLVRSVEDIEKYAEITLLASVAIAKYLPGPLTVVLKAKDTVPANMIAPDGTAAFRISADPLAQSLIASFMEAYNAPLTCTSANVAGLPTLETPTEILAQFGERAHMITQVIDDGARAAESSTIVRFIGDSATVLRQGTLTVTLS